MASNVVIRSFFENPSPLKVNSFSTLGLIEKDIKGSSTLRLISNKIENKESLANEDITILIKQKLPLLQFLAQKVIHNYKIPTTARIKHVLFIPLSEAIELKGAKKAVGESLNTIYCNSKIENNIIQIVIDRWFGNFQNEKLDHLLKSLSNFHVPDAQPFLQVY